LVNGSMRQSNAIEFRRPVELYLPDPTQSHLDPGTEAGHQADSCARRNGLTIASLFPAATILRDAQLSKQCFGGFPLPEPGSRTPLIRSVTGGTCSENSEGIDLRLAVMSIISA